MKIADKRNNRINGVSNYNNNGFYNNKKKYLTKFEVKKINGRFFLREKNAEEEVLYEIISLLSIDKSLNSIFNLSIIYGLNLSRCELKILNINFDLLIRLRHLDISFNKFEEINIIGDNKLFYLNLSGTYLKDFWNLLNSNLTYLDCSSNFINNDEIVKKISTIKSLTHLNMSNVDYTIDMEYIVKLTNLNYLNLGYNFIGGILTKKITNLSKLTYLNLKYNNFIIRDIDFSLIKTLKFLDIEYNKSVSINFKYYKTVDILKIDNEKNETKGEVDTEGEVEINKNEITNKYKNNEVINNINCKVNGINVKFYGYSCCIRNANLSNIIISYRSIMNKLILTNCKLTGRFPKEITELINLTLIDLSNNELTDSVPKELNNLVKLTSLNINKNNISKFECDINQLTNLKELKFSNNPITLGPIINNLKLTTLNYSFKLLYYENKPIIDTKILENADELILSNVMLNNNVSVLSLNITILSLCRCNLYIIPQALNNLISLKTLVLDDNYIHKAILVNKLTELNTLSFVNNRLNCSINAFKYIKKFKQLKIFNISFNEIFGSFPTFLNDLPLIDQFNLAGTKIYGRPSQILENKLSVLNIKNTDIQKKVE